MTSRTRVVFVLVALGSLTPAIVAQGSRTPAATAAKARPAAPSPVATAIQNYMVMVRDAGVPPALRTETLRRLDALLARSPDEVARSGGEFERERARFREQMDLVAEFDALSARALKETPVGFPEFLRNARAEISRYRDNVGNPAGFATADTYAAIKVDFERRLELIELLADARERMKLLPPEAQPALRARLDSLRGPVEKFIGGGELDSLAIRGLHKELVKP